MLEKAIGLNLNKSYPVFIPLNYLDSVYAMGDEPELINIDLNYLS